jgi:CRP-like cAMP-binding protein
MSVDLNNISDSSLQYISSYLQRFMPFTIEDVKGLIQYCEIRKFDKRIEIVKEGEIDNYLNMVLKGLVRKFVKVKGKETILQLATEGHVIHSEISYLTRTPSQVILETLEPTTMVSINYKKMEEALASFPKGERLGRLIMSGMFVKKDERRYWLLSKSTRQRFIDYLNRNPHMLQRVPQKYLASYLNITSETFSRFKHLIKETTSNEIVNFPGK